jgi:chitinase
MLPLLLLSSALAASARSVAVPAELLPRNVDAMTIDITCHWSNCGESCPIGFVSVPRKGGKKGEMMWEGVQCDGKGLSRLCCPSNQPQPTCRWSGHHNSGHCTPECAAAEVEVWNISVGCKSGYQSACCTNNTPSVEAYDKCRWVGDSPACWGGKRYRPLEVCPADFPKAAIETKNGFGGEEQCTSGT